MTSNKRRQKREQERKILAEMETAMQEQRNTPAPQAPPAETPPTTPTVHCKRCKTVMEQGVCPTCGFRIYQPMDEKLRRKIRWIVTGVCLVAFVIVYFAFIK